MTLHERERIEFRKQRVEEASDVNGSALRNARYAGAFHDGQHVLSTVRDETEEVFASRHLSHDWRAA